MALLPSVVHSLLSAMIFNPSLTASAVKTFTNLSVLPSMMLSAFLQLVRSREQEPMAP